MKNENTALLKTTTEYDQIKELKLKTEKHDYDNILKTLEKDRDYYKKTEKKRKGL